MPSSLLALSANTSPVVIRQLIGRLRAAGLVTCRQGKGGGAILTRPAEAITLLDIFDAVETATVFGTPRSEPCPECPVGRNVLAALGQVTQRAVSALRAELAETTVQRLVDEIVRLSSSADVTPADSISAG